MEEGSQDNYFKYFNILNTVFIQFLVVRVFPIAQKNTYIRRNTVYAIAAYNIDVFGPTEGHEGLCPNTETIVNRLP